MSVERLAIIIFVRGAFITLASGIEFPPGTSFALN